MGKKYRLTGIVEEQPDGTMRVLGVISGSPQPAVPNGLRLIESAIDHVTIAWDDVGDALSWNVKRGGSPLGSSSVAQYNDTTVVADTEYSYTVSAVNGSGESDHSQPLVVVTPVVVQPQPPVPTNFILVDSGANFVRLEWDDSTDVTSWEINRDGLSYATGLITSSFLDSSVIPNTGYTYRVRALNSAGASALSDPIVLTTPDNLLPEWSLENQSLTVGTSYFLDLATVCNDLDGQPLVFSLITTLPAGLVLGTSTISGVPTLAATTSVTLRVDDGIDTSDVTVDFVVSAAADTTAPAPPTSVSATANGSTVTVAWTDSTDPSGIFEYRIFRNGSQVGTDLVSPFTQTGVANGTYTYTMRAVDNSPARNVSALSGSSVVVVNVLPQNPDVPTYNVINVLSSTSFAHSWTAGLSGVTPTGYELDRSLTGTGGWTNRFTGLATSFTDTGLTASTQYFYRLRALSAALTSGYATRNATTNAGGGTATPDYVDPVATVTLGARAIINATPANFIAVIAGASSGQTVQLAVGNYSGNATTAVNSPATSPVIIKGAANFGSVWNGRLTMNGAYAIVVGVDLSGNNCGINFGGLNNKAIGCKIHGFGSASQRSAIPIYARPEVGGGVTGIGRKLELAYCEIYSPGPWQSTDIYNQSRIGMRTGDQTEATFHKDAWVHHNHWHDFPTKPIPNAYTSGQCDFMEVGQTSNSRPYVWTIVGGWYIENNLFERHLQGHGIIDLKTGGHVFRRNTMLNNKGSADMRCGNASVFESNWYEPGENQPVSVIHGRSNRVLGNRVVSGRIIALAGTAPDDNSDGSISGGGHSRCRDSVFAGNTGTLYIGYQYDETIDSWPALDNRVEAHAGSAPRLFHQQGTVQVATTTAVWSVAVKLSTAQVGPAAIPQASSAYRAARGL